MSAPPPPALHAAPADWAALCGGAPLLLLLGEAMAAGVPDLPGIALWCAAPAPDGALRLHRPGTPPPAAPAALPGLPAGLIGILAPPAQAATAAALAAAWGGRGAPPVTAPPVIAWAPDTGPAALAGLLAAALAARTAEVAQGLAAMATLREEAEATRMAMAALMQATGHEAAPPPVLTLAAEPDAAAHAVGTAAAGLVLAQRLGSSLEGIAAVGLHVAAAGTADPAAALAIRLVGEESGRVRAAWAVPGAALVPGWLMLDLPVPLGPWRESAVLEVVAPGDLALSLEAAAAPPDRCVAVQAGAAAPGRALAVRLWTAAFGRRFVLAAHWDWESQDGAPAGVAQAPPEQVWAAAQVVAGRAVPVGLGADGPLRPVVALDPGDPPALLLLPAVPVPGLDLIEAAVEVPLGEAGALEAALWVQPRGWPIGGLASLSLTAPGARCTGWRRADALRGGLTLALRLPAGGDGAPVAVALALRHAGSPRGTPGDRAGRGAGDPDRVGDRVGGGAGDPDRVGDRVGGGAGDRDADRAGAGVGGGGAASAGPATQGSAGPATQGNAGTATQGSAGTATQGSAAAGAVADGPLRVVWQGLTGRRLSAPLPPPPPRPARIAPSAAFLAAAPVEAVPRIDPAGGVRLHELFAMEGGGYRHLDIIVDGLRVGALAWPRLRFKFARNGGAPQIEVRARPDWPVLFERWPGTQADEHGPFLLLTEADAGGRAAERMRTERDRRVLLALLRLLPTLVASAARGATLDPAEYDGWVAEARRFAALLLPAP